DHPDLEAHHAGEGVRQVGVHAHDRAPVRSDELVRGVRRVGGDLERALGFDGGGNLGRHLLVHADRATTAWWRRLLLAATAARDHDARAREDGERDREPGRVGGGWRHLLERASATIIRSAGTAERRYRGRERCEPADTARLSATSRAWSS